MIFETYFNNFKGPKCNFCYCDEINDDENESNS